MIVGAHREAHEIRLREIDDILIYNQVSSQLKVSPYIPSCHL
jgi:hypothetical protein